VYCILTRLFQLHDIQHFSNLRNITTHISYLLESDNCYALNTLLLYCLTYPPQLLDLLQGHADSTNVCKTSLGFNRIEEYYVLLLLICYLMPASNFVLLWLVQNDIASMAFVLTISSCNLFQINIKQSHTTILK
jgi:hypothetical protein